jgi:hypothetical protein
MERRRYKARRAANEAIRGASKQIDKPVLVGRIDRKDIYQRDDVGFILRFESRKCLVSLSAREEH